ncbi:MFS transporter [Tsukamurella soli]|uniref:MFS transporter n=1 Tax=Tsukamurella soli TaxID=644556 RepID=A0ABP8J1L2_9ACTN
MSTSSGSETRTDPPSLAGKAVDPRRRWFALVVLALAQLMVVLDATIVNIALPTAQSDLGFSNDSRQWVVTGYALAFGSLLLLGGRLADFFGRRRLFIIGLIGFALASALGGFAESLGVLLTARVLQGAFGALLAPAALSLLSVTFTTAKDRGRAFGIFSSISGGGGAIGLLLGGVLTEYASWRWCLFVNLVIAAIALIGAAMFLDRDTPATRPKLDLPGVFTSVLGLVGIVYGLGNTSTHGWTEILTLGPVIAGAALLVAFVIIERRGSRPLLPMRVVVHRNRGAAYLVVAITGIAMFGIFLFLTYYITDILKFTPIETGASFLPMIVFLIIGATVSGSVLLPKFGPRPIVPVGAAIAAVGLVLLTRLDFDSSYAAGVLPALTIIGLGLGMVFGPIQNAATSAVETRDSGVASAMVNTASQLGGSVGTAILSSFFATAVTTYVSDHAAKAAGASKAVLAQVTAEANLAGYHTVFWYAAGFLILGAIIATVIFKSGPLEIDPDADLVVAH